MSTTREQLEKREKLENREELFAAVASILRLNGSTPEELAKWEWANAMLDDLREGKNEQVEEEDTTLHEYAMEVWRSAKDDSDRSFIDEEFEDLVNLIKDFGMKDALG